MIVPGELGTPRTLSPPNEHLFDSRRNPRTPHLRGRQTVAAVLGVRWTDRAGWTVAARTTAGDAIQIHARRARVLLPRRAAGTEITG